MAKQRKTVTEP